MTFMRGSMKYDAFFVRSKNWVGSAQSHTRTHPEREREREKERGRERERKKERERETTMINIIGLARLHKGATIIMFSVGLGRAP
jgi:hypothetical protein